MYKNLYSKSFVSFCNKISYVLSDTKKGIQRLNVFVEID